VEASKEDVVPESFEKTHYSLSVFELQDEQSDQKRLVKRSQRYQIYARVFEKGPVSLEFPQNNKKNFVIFFLEQSQLSYQSCGGAELVLSDPQGRIFEDCSESSKINKFGWDCRAAFSQRPQDDE